MQSRVHPTWTLAVWVIDVVFRNAMLKLVGYLLDNLQKEMKDPYSGF